MHTRPLGHLPHYGLTMQRLRPPHRGRSAKSKPALTLIGEAQEFLVIWKIEENLPKEYCSTEFPVMQNWGISEPASTEGHSKIEKFSSNHSHPQGRIRETCLKPRLEPFRQKELQPSQGERLSNDDSRAIKGGYERRAGPCECPGAMGTDGRAGTGDGAAITCFSRKGFWAEPGLQMLYMGNGTPKTSSTPGTRLLFVSETIAELDVLKGKTSEMDVTSSEPEMGCI